MCTVEMEENGLMTKRVQGCRNLMVNEIDAGLMQHLSLRNFLQLKKIKTLCMYKIQIKGGGGGAHLLL